MKNAILAVLFFAGISFSSAQIDMQDDFQETILDKLEQEPLPPTQVLIERTSKLEAQRLHNEKKAERRAKRLAKKLAKQKQPARQE